MCIIHKLLSQVLCVLNVSLQVTSLLKVTYLLFTEKDLL